MTDLPIDPQLAVIALAALCSTTLLAAAFHPSATHDDLRRARLQAVAGTPARHQAGTEDNRRRRVVEDTLKEMEAKRKARLKAGTRPTLVGRLRQAGLGWSKKSYVGISVACGISIALLVIALSGLGPFAAIGFGIAAGLLLPHLYVAQKRKSRFKAFSAEFPEAVDVIVRGVKAGLPLVDCLKTIAAEAQEPVRSEFRTLVQDQMLGMPLDEAVQRVADRVPLSESSFFAIVIAMQSRSGGNLSEALGNLSKVLRERKKMRAKIRAMSTEAKASAGIIGCIPVVVSLLIYFTSPDYMALLLFTDVGQIVLVACLGWMTIGCLIMRKMINFDF